MNATRPSRFALIVAVTAVSLFSYRWSVADDQTEPPDTATAEKITRWIQQLDANEFSARSEASRSLQQLGAAACPALAQAAVDGSREQRMRALEILGQHFEEGHDPIRQAAAEALKKVASGTHVASARRANEILEPKQKPLHVMVPNVAPAQIQIQVEAIARGAGGRGMQRIQIRNGVKQIETDDGQRRIKIVEDADKGIEVEITQKKGDKDTTEKFQAKNAEELAKKDPEIHKLYQRMQDGRGVPIQGIPAAVPAGPLQWGGPQQGLDIRRQTIHRMLQSSRRMLETSIQQLELTKGDGENAKKIDESIQRLRDITRQLEQEERKLAGEER